MWYSAVSAVNYPRKLNTNKFWANVRHVRWPTVLTALPQSVTSTNILADGIRNKLNRYRYFGARTNTTKSPRWCGSRRVSAATGPAKAVRYSRPRRNSPFSDGRRIGIITRARARAQKKKTVRLSGGGGANRSFTRAFLSGVGGDFRSRFGLIAAVQISYSGKRSRREKNRFSGDQKNVVFLGRKLANPGRSWRTRRHVRK